ncbi:uncharacterized protein DUF5004 [Arcticibacter tournemirensis]|uniref:DUF5004 domain-containing protein n=1 Tax=Arcticibacter tournemirensis TaxID=699437 RepID=A0A5M9GZB4_9SPHI|nr:DUF5004 domain-containing protein [Arcticibacter tournemirensis]KAA8479105.1 DUF5004 domain-containing protein [Arcticibacter tournemirensis]TQM48641.1 uncharacterized protein DUF5004 [Arcticibacter tournemirensis]
MKKYRIILKVCLALSVLSSGLAGCSKEMTGLTMEPMKDIAGTWKVVQVTRNEEDLSQRLDLSAFRFILKQDYSYSFVDKFPFVVNKAGTFSLDDPQYPFYLLLKPTGGVTESKVSLQLPVKKGKTQLSMTLSPGCSTNKYRYVFEKVQD